ncbi:SDR family NAD(P)-dependent oxidoreductase [Streptomyces sp. BK340]|uniref:SDR family NAD(P)-dependent oxidoreductase n=1 Tax=Streptomyces sp. BK340 TaxID=2572903 RepID=UPI0011AAEBC7|nr:SDR family oxidoreductase [Streptomyces sp. BK340]TVZ84903.1 3-oxoacyl-[acyl-carrier protein] reductase [Streptomyces sp. BK340]
MTDVALVSGGSRGLGRTLVTRLLAAGWRVATFSRTASDFVQETLEGSPGRFFWTEADLHRPDSVRAAAKAAIGHFGQVDLLVNNAGVLDQGLFVTMPPEQAEALITANLTSPVALSQVAARSMVASGGGQIINISSVNAVRGYRGVAAYSAAKAGLDGLTQSLARELGPASIRVNTVVPGFFDSDMTEGVTSEYRERIQRRTPLGRIGDREEIADAVLFLASPLAGFVTGQRLVIDGGITC